MGTIGCFALGILTIMVFLAPEAGSQGIDELLLGAMSNPNDTDQMMDPTGEVMRIELDMLITKEQAAYFMGKSKGKGKSPPRRRKRKAVKPANQYRWPNKTIPYKISDEFSHEDKKLVMEAIDDWRKYTCINFQEGKKTDKHQVLLHRGEGGCYSYVGKVDRKGTQDIGLSEGCMVKGIIIHEIGHAVGFYHEQSRPDRDDYVRIVEENIFPSNLHNFAKQTRSSADTMGVPYDFGSVMHYGSQFFSKNGKKTIVTLDPRNQKIIGNREGLSFYDIMLANKMYSCSEKCRKSIVCPEEGFLNKNCKCWCPGNPVRECDPVETGTGTTLKPCRDMNKRCKQWQNRCSLNRIKVVCKDTCGMCKVSPPTTATTPVTTITHMPCEDDNRFCPMFGNFCHGWFESFFSWLCPNTCGTCDALKRDAGKNRSSKNSQISFTMTAASIVTAFLAARKMCHAT